MKNQHYILLAVLFLTAAACTPKTTVFDYEQRAYSDSTSHSYLTVNVELPLASGAASRAVRSSLLDLMDRSLSHAATYEEERAFPRFSGDPDDTDALMSYYEQRTLQHLGALSQADFDERERSILENTGLSQAEKDEMRADAPKWSYDFNLRKEGESDRYVVFSNLDQTYMGGAHGGVIGSGYPVFDKRDGHQVTPVLRPDCTDDIQPLLVRGLQQYFKECGMELTEDELFEQLMLEEERRIPLPTWDPYPTKDGLAFVYQQYEIASYATGMPAFVLPFAEVGGFLSEDARDVFGL